MYELLVPLDDRLAVAGLLLAVGGLWLAVLVSELRGSVRKEGKPR